jgi:ABC-type lipoprotein release transport system permease subunit
MSGNLYEQIKEIAIMRAVGFTKANIISIYLYESFIVIMSGSLLGMLVGISVGWTITVQ